MRDSQRAKVYRAEMILRPYRPEGEGDFSSIEEVRAWVQKLCRSAWFRRRYGLVWAPVKWKRSGAATGGYAGLKLPRWAWNKPVVLHELAHCIVRDGTNGWHGCEFADTYRTLVRYAMGGIYETALVWSFQNEGVRYTPTGQKRQDMAARPKPKIPSP